MHFVSVQGILPTEYQRIAASMSHKKLQAGFTMASVRQPKSRSVTICPFNKIIHSWLSSFPAYLISCLPSYCKPFQAGAITAKIINVINFQHKVTGITHMLNFKHMHKYLQEEGLYLFSA